MARHPALDRRHVTQERERAAVPEPSPHEIYARAPLPIQDAELRRLLTEVAAYTRASIDQICVTDREPAQEAMEHFPVRGACRSIVRRTGGGGKYTLAANTPLLICEANEARLGGRIAIPAATAEVDLALTVDLVSSTGVVISGGVPIIGLLQGAQWDFKLGELLWCGNVIATSTAPATITVAEV